jgi:hypothetical protein
MKAKKVSKTANAQSRPGLSSTMMQGRSTRNGDADKAGHIGQVMQNNKNPRFESPAGNLRKIMGQ